MANSRLEKPKAASAPATPPAQPLAPVLLQRATAAAARRRATCQGTRLDGGACGMTATLASGGSWCIRHSPDISDEQRLVWVQRGGYAATRSAALPPDTPDPEIDNPDKIATVLKETAGQLRRGEISPSIAVALTGLLNTALRSYEASLGRRLADLEALAASRAKQGMVVRVEK
jgi:hypothetical protein